MNNKRGVFSMAILSSCAILSKYLVVLPEYMVKYVGNAAWIDILGKCIIATISFSIVLWLYKPFAPLCFADTFTIAFGKAGDKIFRYVYVILFTLFNSLLLRLLAEALSTVMATTAPDEFFALFIIVAVFFAAYSGAYASSNLSLIIFPLVVITVFTVVIALIPHYRPENIMPIFGVSQERLLKGIFVKHFGFAETILLLFFAPMAGSYKEIKKSGFLTFGIITIISVTFTLAYCLTVPYPASKTFFLPFYQMTRMIKSGAFLQRLEPIVVFVWTSFVMCSMSIIINVTAKLLSGFDDKGTEKPLIPVLTAITFFISMLPGSESSAFNFYEKMLSTSTILFPTAPVMILSVARIRRKVARK